jgi:hypothetical protein
MVGVEIFMLQIYEKSSKNLLGITPHFNLVIVNRRTEPKATTVDEDESPLE